jgi:kynurenine formamidase
VSAFAGGLKFADDVLILFSHGTTHTDALGHAWYGDQIYNGYDAKSTVGWMRRASVCPIGERGVVGRAVLVDMARYLGKPHLDMGEEFSLDQLLAAANQQGSAIRPRDILVVRTGWVKAFREDRASMMSARPYNEPGLEFGSHVIDWFWRMEIPALATDTLGNELTLQPDTGVHGAFHAGLMRNLGVTFHEILDLEALANDCCDDGQYTFLFAAAPLKVVGGTGGPVNPIAIK